MIIEVQLYEDYLKASSVDLSVALLGSCVWCVVGGGWWGGDGQGTDVSLICVVLYIVALFKPITHIDR